MHFTTTFDFRSAAGQNANDAEDDFRLVGDPKPVFIKQHLDKGDPAITLSADQNPKEIQSLLWCARYRYDEERLEFFPPSRFGEASRNKVPWKNLKLPAEKNQGKRLNPSTIWGTRAEITALFSDESVLRAATGKDAKLDWFRDDTEVRVFMDLAYKVIPLPEPLDASKEDFKAEDRPLTLPCDHLHDVHELQRELVEGRDGDNVLKRYRYAVHRAPYFLTQQLHAMQLRFLEAVHRELVNLDQDSKENMSIPALLEPLPPQPAAEQVLEVEDVEPQLGADDL